MCKESLRKILLLRYRLYNFSREFAGGMRETELVVQCAGKMRETEPVVQCAGKMRETELVVQCAGKMRETESVVQFFALLPAALFYSSHDASCSAMCLTTNFTEPHSTKPPFM